MTDIIVIAVLAVILIVSIRYIVRSRKRGSKCIGCSAADTCPYSGCGGKVSCDHDNKDQ